MVIDEDVKGFNGIYTLVDYDVISDDHWECSTSMNWQGRSGVLCREINWVRWTLLGWRSAPVRTAVPYATRTSLDIATRYHNNWKKSQIVVVSHRGSIRPRSNTGCSPGLILLIYKGHSRIFSKLNTVLKVRLYYRRQFGS